jgi:hypothetical protein
MNSTEIKLTDAMEPYRGLITVLVEEVQGLAQLWQSDTSQFAKRTIVRTAFSVVEGLVNLTKQYLLDTNMHIFSPEEIVALKESTIRINQKGDVEEKDYFPRVQENVLFAFNMLQKATYDKHDIDRKSPYWKKFGELTNLRNVLTHPKVCSNLQISSTHLYDPAITMLWLLDNAVEVACVRMGRETIESKNLSTGWSILVDSLFLLAYVPASAVITDTDVKAAIENALNLIEADLELQCMAFHDRGIDAIPLNAKFSEWRKAYQRIAAINAL